MSLRFRLNLMIALTMLIIIGVGALFVVHNARRSVIEEVRSSVNMALQLIDSGLAHVSGDEAALMAWLQELSLLEKTRHLHIQVQQPPQKVIRLSSPPSADHADVPAWFVWAVTPALMIGEKEVTRSDGSPVHIAIEANPHDEIAEAWNEASGFLSLMIALAVAVCALVHVTLGRAFKSVGLILKGLENIERGDYHQRLPSFSLPEFDRISQTFNHTAQTLATARDENRALTQRSLAIQEEERRHIARELHDELGQSVGAIKLRAAALRRDGDGQQTEAVEAIMAICDHLFGVVRALMRRLRPLMLDELGLAASLQDMVENWRNAHPDLQLAFHCEPAVDDRARGADIHLFRIVQECLTNIVKHAHADHASVSVRLGDADRILLDVGDDGIGFDPAQPTAGFGVLGMRERVASLGGEFVLQSAPGRGVCVHLSIPCLPEHP